jgi:hypothetical protein
VDEFDIGGDDAPVGVHRAPRTRWSAIWPFFAVAAAAVIVAVVVVWFASRDQTDTTDVAVDTPSIEETQASVEPSIEDTPTVTEEPPPAEPTGPDLQPLIDAADLGAVIRIINASGTAGEETRGQDALAAWGFTQIVTEPTFPAGQTPPTASIIYYEPAAADTANALGTVLGIPADRSAFDTVNKLIH